MPTFKEIKKKKKSTRAWRTGGKSTLRNLPSETDEDGQQGLARVAIFKQNTHTHTHTHTSA
ncbi:hypothetical protein D7B62_12995 [Staphylococcus aureus]|nr:hypothetical protein D7B62_12995 [Staphylococcus aureus]